MDETLHARLLEPWIGRNRDTAEHLTRYYIEQGNNPFKAAELAESNAANFVEFVNLAIRKADEARVPRLFSFASKEIVVVNDDYFKIRDIHRKLVAMDWREFEHMSAEILAHCFGAVDVTVTQATADGGLDFEGRLPIRALNAEKPYGYIQVYGQSKRYGPNVGRVGIDGFVAFANARKRESLVAYTHPPQLFMFFTTSDFAPNALKLCADNGFIALSGLQLAYLIHLHKAGVTEHRPALAKLLADICTR